MNHGTSARNAAMGAVIALFVGVMTNLVTGLPVFQASTSGESSYPRLIWILFAFAAIAAIFWAVREHFSTRTFSPSELIRARQQMLFTMDAYWIREVLEKSLAYRTAYRTPIKLGLQDRPSLIRHPLETVGHRPSQTPRELPPHTTIDSVFDLHSNGLLLLGAPGAGKSTLLLELMRTLLARASHDPHHQIPVIFKLSSWGRHAQPIETWMSAYLKEVHQIDRLQSDHWISTGSLLPLFDGLDEVAPEHRESCLEALISYKQTRGLEPLVLTSRLADYEQLSSRLKVDGAISILPLSPASVDAWLKQHYAHLGALPEAVRAYPGLAATLHSPLMLHVASKAYGGEMLPPPAAGVTWEAHLYRCYVDEMLKRRETEWGYTPEQVHRWLGWLAVKMQQWKDFDFRLDELGVRLPNRTLGVLCALIALLWTNEISTRYEYDFLAFWLAPETSLNTLLFIVSTWIFFGDQVADDFRITRIPRFTYLALSIIGLLWAESWWRNPYMGTWPNLLALGLTILACLLLAASSAVNIPNARAAPNAAIRSGLRRQAFFTAAGFTPLLLATIREEMMLETAVAFTILLTTALNLAASRLGGSASMYHYMVRITIFLCGFAPLNYTRFIDYCCERLLLTRAGGAYYFVHRTILEYFADHYRQTRRSP